MQDGSALCLATGGRLQRDRHVLSPETRWAAVSDLPLRLGKPFHLSKLQLSYRGANISPCLTGKT